MNSFIKDRVTGTLNILGKEPTFAAWIRTFVLNHPEYKKDSIITEVQFLI